MTSKKKILLVEDEAISAMFLQAELTASGYGECVIAASGEEALAAVEREVPAVILMDIHLAGKLDGIETAALIRERYDMPIVFVTGYEDSDILSRSRGLSRVAYAEKPVRVPALRRLIDRLLAG